MVMIEDERKALVTQVADRYEEEPLYVQVEKRIQDWMHEKNLKVGDSIHARYTEAMAISVEKP